MYLCGDAFQNQSPYDEITTQIQRAYEFNHWLYGRTIQDRLHVRPARITYPFIVELKFVHKLIVRIFNMEIASSKLS